jgi:hypothetical protein
MPTFAGRAGFADPTWRRTAAHRLAAGKSCCESTRLVPGRNTCGTNIAGEKNINDVRPGNDYRRESCASPTTEPQTIEKQRFWLSWRSCQRGGGRYTKPVEALDAPCRFVLAGKQKSPAHWPGFVAVLLGGRAIRPRPFSHAQPTWKSSWMPCCDGSRHGLPRASIRAAPP